MPARARSRPTANQVCWGYNGNGQTTIPPDIGSVTQISAGGLHTCAVKSDGTIACWGENEIGQSGDPPHFTSAPVDEVVGPTGIDETVTATASPPITQLELSSGTLPAGISFGPMTHTLSGVPTEAGTFTGTFRAGNEIFSDANQSFTIRVDLSAPTTTDDVPATVVGAPVEVTLSATNSGGAAVDKTYYTTGASPTIRPRPPTSTTPPPVRSRSSQTARGSSTSRPTPSATPRRCETSATAQVDLSAPTTTDDVPGAVVRRPGRR